MAAVEQVERLVEFRGRAPGTDAERRAARHLERRLAELGRAAEAEPTFVHPNYPLAHALHAFVAITGSVLSVDMPVAGAALVLAAALSAFLDLSGSLNLVRRLTGRRASQNVTSREGGDKPGVLVLVAHYDVARAGGPIMRRPGAFAVFLGAMLTVLGCCVLRLGGVEGVPLTAVQFVPTVLLIASIPPLVDIVLSPPQEGANDNASGVATVLRLAERLGSRLEHFDVWVVLPGAGEGMPGGMRAWLRAHRGELDPQRTVFVNVDAVGAGILSYVAREGPIAGWRYHPELVRICEEIGGARRFVSRHSSDGLAARAAGFPAITITARNSRGLAPTDVDAAALEDAYAFCSELAERVDAEVGPELS